MIAARALLLLVVVLSIGCAGPDAAVHEASAPTTHRLRVMAYNIKHGRGMDRKIDLERIARVIRDEAPDVVLLQEVDKNCGRADKDLQSRLCKPSVRGRDMQNGIHSRSEQ